MKTLLAAALLALPASPARALDETTFLGYLKYNAKQLSGLDAEVGRINLVSPSLGPMPDGSNSNAQYDGMSKKLVLNAARLAAAETEVKACARMPEGMSVEWVLAVHALPTFMHELRHSYNESQLGEFGNNREEEVSGYITTMAAYRQAREKWPSAYDCGSIFASGTYQLKEKFWKPQGVAGLEAYLKQSKYYGKACSVRSESDHSVCKDLAVQRWERLRALDEALRKPGADAGQACAAVADKIKDDSCSSKDEAVRLLWDAAVGKMFWASAKRVQEAKVFYNDQEWPRGAAEWAKEK